MQYKRGFDQYHARIDHDAIKRKAVKFPIDRIAVLKIQSKKIPINALYHTLVRRDVEIDILRKELSNCEARLWEAFLYLKQCGIDPASVWKTTVFENGVKNSWYSCLRGAHCRLLGASRSKNVDENLWREQYWYTSTKQKLQCTEFWITSQYDEGLGFPKQLGDEALKLIAENFVNTVAPRWRALQSYFPRKMIKSETAVYVSRGDDSARRGDNRIRLVVKLYSHKELEKRLNKTQFIKVAKNPPGYYYKNFKLHYSLMMIDSHWQMYYAIQHKSSATINTSRKAWHFGHESASAMEATIASTCGVGLFFDKDIPTQTLRGVAYGGNNNNHNQQHHYHNNSNNRYYRCNNQPQQPSYPKKNRYNNTY